MKSFLLALALLSPAYGETLIATTENYPPFNMSLDGGQTIIGISTELLRELSRRTRIEFDIGLYPWSRAYRMAITRDETCVYSTTRTPERESNFKWVGPLVSNDWVLYTRADNKVTLNRIEDARPYLLGAYQDDAVSNYLHDYGYRVEDAIADNLNARKLALGRIDFWATGRLLGAYLAQQENLGPFRLALSFHQTEMYLACNPGVGDEVVERLNQALAEMRQDGSVERIHSKYLERPLR
ncbi:substrate-binding periplasmic protein [Chitinimonas lacunae]|uniref:Substrate-binding periplasmic protein n=1 Tax=Chitinimonas lacunae TaxID=1963018 RepID=A0ABV8MUI3_9NEIS